MTIVTLWLVDYNNETQLKIEISFLDKDESQTMTTSVS